MAYNPIFEEELERDEELRKLKDSICYRATKDQLIDVVKQAVNFVAKYPLVSVIFLGLFGLGARD